MLLCPVTLREQTHLELQYDGPLPAYALADLRRMQRHAVTVSALTDRELSQWLALARSNLKAEQRKLADVRRLCSAHKRWRLQQCRDARVELWPLAAEDARRSKLRSRSECLSPTAPHHHHSAM